MSRTHLEIPGALIRTSNVFSIAIAQGFSSRLCVRSLYRCRFAYRGTTQLCGLRLGDAHTERKLVMVTPKTGQEVC